MTDGRDPSKFYKLFKHVADKLHYSKVYTIQRDIQCVKLPSWDNLDNMSSSWQQTLDITNNLSLTATKEIRKETRKTVTVKRYWLVWIFAHLPVKSVFNFNKETDPMVKVTLNVQFLESPHLEGTSFISTGSQTDP
jgi:hypothetical protein